jgi:hypothetical protein
MAPAFNRVNRQRQDLPERLLGGIWQASQAGQLNGLPVPKGTPLLPDDNGELNWATEEQPIAWQARGPSVPQDATLNLGSLEQSLDHLLDFGGTFREWTAVSPLDRNLADDLGRWPLEEEIEQHLKHLEAVCRFPRTHLEIIEERQMVSRARQVPARAISYLAAHTEDWEAKTLRGVRPRRVIANVREERYDLYENRVAVRLVDHLLKYVRGRITKIQELLRTFQVVEANSHQPPSGMHWRQSRLYELWGNTLDVLQGQLLAEERLEELQRFQRQLVRLQGSPLYRSVSQQVQVPAQLRITNILGNDAHYRRVARLWLGWYRYAHVQRSSAQEQQQTALQAAHRFDVYGVLLTLQALKQFGYTAVDNSTLLQRDGAFTLTGPEGPLTLDWDADGTHLLRTSTKSLLRLVALTTPLSALEAEEQARATETLKGYGARLDTFTVVLYPGSSRFEPPPALFSLGDGPQPLHPMLGCVPVSPIDLESVERVARALRRVLTGRRLLMYPPRVELPEVLKRISLPEPFRPDVSGTWTLPAPLADDDWQAPARALSFRLTHLEKQLVHHQQERHGTKLQEQEIAQLRASLAGWKELNVQVAAAEETLDTLSRCPVCSATDAILQAWDQEQFRCTCRGCGTGWSVLVCADCGQRHAWLRPKLRNMTSVTPEVGWADHLFGRDILTLPLPEDLSRTPCAFNS